MARRFVVISKDEAESLLDLLECDLIDIVRANEYFDSLECLRNLCRIADKCEKALKEAEQ